MVHVDQVAFFDGFHNGGTLKVLQDLTLGTATDGQGNYSMLGGSLSVGGHETLGLAGERYLLQSESSTSSGTPPSLGCAPPVGPTHSVNKNLYLGVESGSDGEINLSNSSLTVSGSTKVGLKGTGLFDQAERGAFFSQMGPIPSTEISFWARRPIAMETFFFPWLPLKIRTPLSASWTYTALPPWAI